MNNKLLLVTPPGVSVSDLRTPGVYKIINAEGQIKYVGSSKDLHDRFISHRGRLSRGTHENKNLQTYSISAKTLTFVGLPTDTKEEAVRIEQRYLDSLVGNGVICNISTDAKIPSKGRKLSDERKATISEFQTGRTHSSETKEKMSKSRMGNQYSLGIKQSEDHVRIRTLANTGTTRSEEVKAELSRIKLGNTHALGYVKSAEEKDKISKTKGTPVTIDGTTYQSFNRAAQALGVSPVTVINRCKSNKFSEWKTSE